jgi:cytochrome c-type biogenesis protein CcmE
MGRTIVDLTPREVEELPARTTTKPIYFVVGGLFALAIGFLLFKGIDDASEFFLNADEAVEQQTDLAQRRFRLQGTVVEGSVEEDGDNINFTVEFNAVQVAVRHSGGTAELFQENIPVVLSGNWARSGEYFASDELMVKHSNEYEADYDDRLEKARDGRDAPEESG